MPGAAPAEDGLPEWLRPLQSNQPSTGALRGGGSPPAMPASPYGAPQQPSMFSAGSLVNQDALPEWLREPGMSGVPGRGAQDNGMGAWENQSMRPGMGQPDPYAPPPSPRGPLYASGPYAQERQPLPGGMPPGSSAQALFDESALPDWLKQASASNDIGQQPTAYQPAHAPSAAYGSGMAPQQMSAPNGYSPYGAPQRPSTQGFPPGAGGAEQPWPAPAGAFPSIETAGSFSAAGPSGALHAPSLIDPNALPSWLAGGQAQQAPGSGGLSPSSGMSANSLVDEAALPQWLRAVPPAQARPSAAAYANVPAPAPWTATATSEEPLPTWLKQVYVDANVPQSGTLQAPAGWGAGPEVGAGEYGMGAMAASSFVDDSALPEWLRSAGGAPGAGNGGYQGAPPPPAVGPERHMGPTYAPEGSAAAGGEYSARAAGSFAASDLIDPAVLPSWVQGQEPPPQPSFSSTSGWTSRQRSVSLPNGGASGATFAGANSGMLPYGGERPGNGTAGSGMLLDESNLPVWMRGAQAGRAEPAMETSWNGAASGGPPSTSFESGGLGSSDPRRRGPPIPSEALPTWLRTGGPARGEFAGGGGQGGPAYGAYDEYGAYGAGQQEQGWPEEDGRAAQAAQWTEWDDGQYAEEYGADFDGGDEPQERKRGWRRFFGRG